MHIDEISLDTLKISNAAPPHPFVLQIQEGGTIDVVGIDLAARLERWLPHEQHPADQPFKKTVVDRLEIMRIQSEGLTLELPDDGVVITVPITPWSGTGPMPPMATLNHIVLEGDKPGSGFEYVPGAAGYLKGAARLDSAFVPKLQADIKDRFSGALELRTDKASIGFLARGDTVVDIANPRARMSDPGTVGAPDKTIIVSELGAANVHVEDGKVKVAGAQIDNLQYKQPGVVVTVPKISAPDVIEATKKDGLIPRLEIDEARIQLDFNSMGTGGGSSPPFYLFPGVLADLLDGLQGDVTLNLLIKLINLPARLESRDLNAPAIVHFTDGKIDYQKIQTGLNTGLKMNMADEPGVGSPILAHFVRTSLVFWMDTPSILAVGLHVADVPDPEGMGEPVPFLISLKRWHLETGEITDAQDAHQLRLFRAIHPEKSDDSGPDNIELDTLELQNIVANLHVKSKKPIEFTFIRSPIFGSLTLSPDALLGLRVEGGVSGDTRPPSRGSTPAPTGLSVVTMDALNFDKTNITILGGGPLISTGSITVTKLKNGTVGFRGHKPTDFDARIEKAIATDIRWHL
jgi:hypothetical protein